MHYMHTFLAPAWLACAFLARVLRIARASLDRVLSKTAAASLRSYSRGSSKTSFTVACAFLAGVLGMGKASTYKTFKNLRCSLPNTSRSFRKYRNLGGAQTSSFTRARARRIATAEVISRTFFHHRRACDVLKGAFH